MNKYKLIKEEGRTLKTLKEESWKPAIENVYHRIVKPHLLKDAASILIKKKIVSFPLKVLLDAHGSYAFVYSQFILLAREYVYGYVISVHKDAMAEGIRRRIPLLIYIATANTFYEVNPEQILKEKIDENQKGRAEMINFNIRLGTRREF